MDAAARDPLALDGRYVFVRVLKPTLYGRIVLARDRETDKDVALKYSRVLLQHVSERPPRVLVHRGPLGALATDTGVCVFLLFFRG